MNDDVEELAEYFELSQDKAGFAVGDSITPARMVRMVLTSWKEAGNYSLKSHHFAMIKALVDRVLADFKLAMSRLTLGQRNYTTLQEFRNLRMSTVVPQQQSLENGEKAWAAIKSASRDPAIIHHLVLSAKASATHTPVVIPPWDALSLRMKIETLTAKCEDLLTQAELFVKNDENQLARSVRRLEAPPANYQTQQAAPQHHFNTTAQHLQQQHQQYQQPQASTSQQQPYQQAYNGQYAPSSSYAGQAPHAAIPSTHAEHLSPVSDPIVTHWWQQQDAQAPTVSSSAQVNGVAAQPAMHQVYPAVYNDPTRPIASTSQPASISHTNGASGHYIQTSHQQQIQQQQQLQAQQHRQQQEQQRRQDLERQRQEQERQRQEQEIRERQEQELRERRDAEQRKLLLQQQEERQQQERNRQLMLQHELDRAMLASSQKQAPGSVNQPQVAPSAAKSTSQLPPPTQPQPVNSQLEPKQALRQSTYSSLSGALGQPVAQPPAAASGSTNGNVSQPSDDVNSRAKPPAPQAKAVLDQQGNVSSPAVPQPPAALPSSSDGNQDQRPGDANVSTASVLTFQEKAALYQQAYLERFKRFTANLQQQQARIQPPSVPTVPSASLPPVGPPSTAPQPQGAPAVTPNFPRGTQPDGSQSNGVSQHGTGATQGIAGTTDQNEAARPPTLKRRRASASTPAIPPGQRPPAPAGPSSAVQPPHGFAMPVYPYSWMRPMQFPPPGATGTYPNVKWVHVSQPAHAPNIPTAPGPATARQQQRPAPVTAQAARRSTLARDIFRALEGVSPPEPKSARPAKRKRQPSPPPRRSSSPGSATSEHADIELVTPAVAHSSARAFASSSRLPLDDRMPDPRLTSAFDAMDASGGATIEEVDGRISPVVRKKQPLFWSDSSPDEMQMQASGLSEDDVDNLLGNAEGPTVSSPEGQNLDASRTASSRLFPSSSAVASRGQASTLPGSSSSVQQLSIPAAFRKLRHGWSHPKPDRLIVELPRLPADWRTRKQELDYGSFADFPVRFCTRRCEWSNCPAILDSEDRLRLHWDTVHGAGRSDDRDFSCLWDTCDIRSSSLEKLRHHVRCRHIRDCLRCAYEGCDFGVSNEADLASHVAAEHGNGRLRPFALPQPPVPVQIIPELPQGVQPGWRLTTPVVRPAAMSRERRDQLGNWVLMRIYAKVDFELITTKPTHRKRKDLAPQMKPLMEGFELEMKEQFEWLRPASSDLPKRIPHGVRIGESVGPNAGVPDM